MADCNYCDNRAVYMDDVWCPTSVRCCEDDECMEQAQHDLFEAAMVEVSEDDE